MLGLIAQIRADLEELGEVTTAPWIRTTPAEPGWSSGLPTPA